MRNSGRPWQGTIFQLSGYGVMNFATKLTCYRGKCTWPHFSRLSGHFVDGVLQGPVVLVSADQQQVGVEDMCQLDLFLSVTR